MSEERIEQMDDVVDFLLRRKEYHTQQIDKIEKMIALATSDDSVVEIKQEDSKQNKFFPKTNIPWTKHIREIFSKENTVLTTKQLIERLIFIGVSDKKTVTDSYNTIVGAIVRLVKKEELIRGNKGTILRGPKHPQSVSDKELHDLLG